MNLVFIIIGLAVAIGILISPVFGLALTFILIPVSTQLTMGMSFLGIFTMVTPVKIIGTLTFITALIHYSLRKGTWDFLKKPQIRFFWFFLIWIFISGLTQPGFASRENFTMFIANAIFGIIILILIQDIKRFRLMLWFIIITLFFICIHAVSIYTGIYRSEGISYGANEFAIMTLPFIAITFYSYFSEKNKFLSIVSLVASLFILLALLSTMSRGGIIGFTGMLLLIIIKSRKKVKNLFIILLIMVSVFYTIPNTFKERLIKTKITDTATKDEAIYSATRRYYLAQAAWRIFLTHPISGIGIGNYYYENRNYAPISPGRAHNMFLEMMAELGLIGIILFLGIIFYTFKSLNRIIKTNSALSGYAQGFYVGLVGFLVAGLFLHAQQDRILWFLIFMSAALERIYEKNYI